MKPAAWRFARVCAWTCKHSSRSCRRNIALPPPKPRGGPRGAGGGGGAKPSGLLSPTNPKALAAGKVQRKVSNAVAGLVAAGSSLDRAENRGNSCHLSDALRDQGPHKRLPAEILALSRAAYPQPRSSQNSLRGENSAGFPEICATFQRDNLRRRF